MPIDHTAQSEILFDIHRVDAVLGSGIFEPAAARHPLLPSALTELLIRIRDLLAKAEKYAQRVSFTDDVIVKGKVNDVTGLIAFVRDAVCHIDSGKNDHDEVQARVSFNVVFGKACLAELNGVRIESEHEDDVAFFFGAQRLYLRRHLVRAYNEASASLRPHLDA